MSETFWSAVATILVVIVSAVMNWWKGNTVHNLVNGTQKALDEKIERLEAELKAVVKAASEREMHKIKEEAQQLPERPT